MSASLRHLSPDGLVTIELEIVRGGVDILLEINDLGGICDYRQWKDDQIAVSIKDGSGHPPASIEQVHPSFLQIFGDAYALALEICRLCANLDRTYRYSLGEQLRINAVKLVLDIDSASKT